jgi:hypothetical protein
VTCAIGLIVATSKSVHRLHVCTAHRAVSFRKIVIDKIGTVYVDFFTCSQIYYIRLNELFPPLASQNYWSFENNSFSMELYLTLRVPYI